jgi:hypothetical protein
MKLLYELQALVGPKFGLIEGHPHEELYDTLSRVIEHYLGAFYRFQLMQQLFPKEFVKDMDISDETVRDHISRYLKESLRLQIERSEDATVGYFSKMFGGRDASTERTRGISGGETGRPRVKSGANTERTRGRSGGLTETPHTPGKERVSNLSTPIANLLTDLRTIHDDI